MAYKTVWKTKAVEDLKKLSKDESKRIYDRIKQAEKTPQRYLDWIKKFSTHRLRVGDYRVFIDINPAEETMRILTIRHRKNAYKKKIK